MMGLVQGPKKVYLYRQVIYVNFILAFLLCTMNSSVNPVVNKVNSNGSNDPGQWRVPGELVQAVIVVDINVSSSNVAECQGSDLNILSSSVRTKTDQYGVEQCT